MVLLVESENVHELADGIIKLYHDPEYRKKLATNSYNFIQRFNWDSVKKDYLAIFESLTWRK